MAAWRWGAQQEEEALAETIAGSQVQGASQIQQATNTEALMTVQPSMVNGTELRVQELHDTLFLRYSLDPPDLPKYCDSCNGKSTVCHALNCNRVGLVTLLHNKLQDGFVDLVIKYFTPSQVRNNPLIFAVCAVKRPKFKPSGTRGSTDQNCAPPPEALEQKIDLLIRDLW